MAGSSHAIRVLRSLGQQCNAVGPDMNESSAATGDRGFSKYVLVGLAWGASFGLVVPAVVVTLVAVVALPHVEWRDEALGFGFLVAIYWAVLISLQLALMLAPLATILSWLLYRLGVTSRWPFALAGALTTVCPALILGEISFKDDPLKFFDWLGLTFLAWLAAGGAFGGMMGARALQRDLRS